MKLKTTEKGFTLVEVLVALAILGAIMGVMSAAVVIIMKTTSQNNEWNVNLRQVQNAGHWISEDALMAQVVNTTKPGCFLSLSWSEWNGNSNTVDYYYDAFDNEKLMRQLNVRHLDGSTDDSTLLVAEYIVHDTTPTSPTICNWNDDDKKLTVNIRASLHGSRYAERTYEIFPRPAARGG